MIIEKHFTLNRNLKGPDIICSMDGTGLKELVNASKIHNLKKKKLKRIVTKNEIRVSKFAFASVVAIKNIKKGDQLNKSNIWVKRPGNGYFKSNDYTKLIGKIASRDIKIIKLKKDVKKYYFLLVREQIMEKLNL